MKDSLLGKLQHFNQSYSRVQVISGFINGIFLLFIAFEIFAESLERIYSPKEVASEKMFFVSVLGLIVKIINLIKS